MKITDMIAKELLDMLKQDGGEIQIKRNELASQLGCVPSQINYVITSRFTEEQGYRVESRRGGGGYIRIIKLHYGGHETLFHLINTIGESIVLASCRSILQNLHYDKILSTQQCRLMMAVLADQNFKGLPETAKGRLRANLFRSMLAAAAQNDG